MCRLVFTVWGFSFASLSFCSPVLCCCGGYWCAVNFTIWGFSFAGPGVCPKQFKKQPSKRRLSVMPLERRKSCTMHTHSLTPHFDTHILTPRFETHILTPHFDTHTHTHTHTHNTHTHTGLGWPAACLLPVLAPLPWHYQPPGWILPQAHPKPALSQAGFPGDVSEAAWERGAGGVCLFLGLQSFYKVLTSWPALLATSLKLLGNELGRGGGSFLGFLLLFKCL